MTRMYDDYVATRYGPFRGFKFPHVAAAIALAQQRGVPDGLVRNLKAIRPICRNPDVAQYDEDIASLCDGGCCSGELRRWLEASNFSGSEIIDWFDRAKDLDYRETSDGYWYPVTDTFCCDRCGNVNHTDNSHAVLTGRINCTTTGTWCEDCYDVRSFYCDISCENYSESDFTRSDTTDGETICDEWAQRHDWYLNDNGEWSEYPPDEDDEEEPDYGIPDYHNADRNWSCRTATKSLRPFYGFELEVEFDSSVRRKEFYDSEVKCDEWCAERDGSLSDDYGLEIITRPIALDELREPGNLLEKITLALKDYDAGDGGQGYGVHITSNVNRFTYDHQQRIVDLIVDMKPLSEFVARRAQTHYYAYKKDGDKHDAVAPRDNGSFEFRIFRSTVDFAILMSYVEYLEAVFEWTFDPAREFTGPLAMSLFRRWFLQQPEKFPYLTKRFAPITKEIQICASQSSNQPGQRLPKLGFVPALLQTPMAQVSLTAA